MHLVLKTNSLTEDRIKNIIQRNLQLLLKLKQFNKTVYRRANRRFISWL